MDSIDGQCLFSRKASGWFKGLAIIMVMLSHYAEWTTWFFGLEGKQELIRDGLSRLGPYGVAVFFLFSGYGLAKSAGTVRIDFRFVGKRLTGVYIPYLILTIIMECLSDSLHNVDDFIAILYGKNFWYMTVLFLFYAAFMILWFAFTNRHIRAVSMVLFTIVLNHCLMQMEAQDFWYLSNYAFLIGILLTLYEAELLRIPMCFKITGSIIFAVASLWNIKLALFSNHMWDTPVQETGYRIFAVLVFTLWIACLANIWHWYDAVLVFIGKYSLYLYLLHTFIFMWAVNYFEVTMACRFLIAIVVTIVVAVVFGWLYTAAVKRIAMWSTHKK